MRAAIMGGQCYSGATLASATATTNGGGLDACIASFNSTSGALKWFRTFGGSSNEGAWGVVLDASGNSYYAGAYGAECTTPSWQVCTIRGASPSIMW
jgi:hypothetical protein